ncbi:MAG: hypothetical protein LBI48_12225 [Burkholderiaceae bacterium]|nr:hypothetical protein [Burkholderiaceae bacterium]
MNPKALIALRLNRAVFRTVASDDDLATYRGVYAEPTIYTSQFNVNFVGLDQSPVRSTGDSQRATAVSGDVDGIQPHSPAAVRTNAVLGVAGNHVDRETLTGVDERTRACRG